MKLSEMISLNAGLQAIGKEQLPFKISYAMARNSTKIEPFLKAFEAARISLVKAHSINDENGDPKIENDFYALNDKKAFEAQFAELLQQDEQVELFKIKAAMFDNMKVESNIIAALLPIIED